MGSTGKVRFSQRCGITQQPIKWLYALSSCLPSFSLSWFSFLRSLRTSEKNRAKWLLYSIAIVIPLPAIETFYTKCHASCIHWGSFCGNLLIKWLDSLEEPNVLFWCYQGVGNTLKRHYETYLIEYELAHDDLDGECCLLCHRCVLPFIRLEQHFHCQTHFSLQLPIFNSSAAGDWVNCGICGEWAHFGCDRRQGLGAFKVRISSWTCAFGKVGCWTW